MPHPSNNDGEKNEVLYIMFGEEKRRVLSIVFLISRVCVCMYILKNFYLASPFGYCFF